MSVPEDLPLLVVEAVDDLSYSGWSRIRTCLLRAAFALDPATSGLDRGNLYSAIGNARHRLVELVAEGRRGGRPVPGTSWVRDQFDQLVSAERARLIEQWYPAEVPQIRSWPDVALTRAKMARELGAAHGPAWPDVPQPLQHKSNDAGQFGPSAVPELPSPGEITVEATLRDAKRGLWGRIDRIENRSGVIAVVDLKSGIGVSDAVLIERHRLQLLFYAGLVNASYGIWPTLELVPLTGGPVRLEYEQGDVESVRAAAVADRAAFNAAIAAGDLAHSVTVSAERCAWCPYQPVCPALRSQWPQVTSPGGAPPGRSLSITKGRVKEVRAHHSSTDVVITQSDKLTAPAGDVTVTRLPPRIETSIGSELAVCRVSPAGSDSVLRAQWDSTYWIS